MRTRIAPTPSGFLHIGNACSFLLTRQLANQQNGTVRLRIDDIDSNRIKPAYLTDIFEVLQLLEMEYDYGPANVQDFQKRFSQHLRLPLYETLLKDLQGTGLLYACRCSRKLLTQKYQPCSCRRKNISMSSDGVAWRIHTPLDTIINFTDIKQGQQQIHLAKEMPDFVVRKKDGLPAYQIVSLADDIFYGVDYIVRGYDLIASTAAQLYMAQLVNQNGFLKSRFYHHPLLTNLEGLKLSKSAGDRSVKYLLQKKDGVADLQKIVDNWLH